MTPKLIPVGDWSAARHKPPKPAATLRRWCREGKISGAVREGREWRVPEDAEYRGTRRTNNLLELIYGTRRQAA